MNRIGPYQILETLHRGPQPLYKVKAADGGVLALKAAPTADSTPETRERFSREAEATRAMDHPNVVKVVDAGEADGYLYQAMELLDGRDLDKVIAENRTLSWEDKLVVMEQVCDAVAYAHERGLVHRDLKPANLFLENSGRAVVLDFGMVRIAESELTKAGATLGTINYMAPEQVQGERCTAASDVFSLGIAFYHFATGRHPFSSKERSLAQVVSAIVFEAPPKLSTVADGAPDGLEFLLNRALEKDPARRFQDAGEMGQALAVCRVTMSHGESVAEPAGASEKTSVLENPALPAPADGEKTQVFARPAARSAAVAVAPPPPAPAAKPVEAPPPAPGLRFRYCPSCTSANPPDAAACNRCGTPLAASGAAVTKSRNWGMYISLGVAAALAVVLLVVVMAKR